MNTVRLHASAENLSKDYLSPCKSHITILCIFYYLVRSIFDILCLFFLFDKRRH